MEWSEDQNLALVREVLITEPYRFKARTTERGKAWQQIADNLNFDHTLNFPSKTFRVFFRETGVMTGSTNFSSNKRSLRYQSSKTSRVFLKDESIALSSFVRRALNVTCSILICFSSQGGGVFARGFLWQTHVLFSMPSDMAANTNDTTLLKNQSTIKYLP